MVTALGPEVVTARERHRFWVETCGRHSRGQSLLNCGRSGEEPNAEVVTALDHARVLACFRQALVG